MRALSTANETEIALKITRPIIIVELTLSVVYRWSSQGAPSWNGNTYTANGVHVEDLQHINGGSMIGSISVPNADFAAAALALGSDITDAPCKIWKLYGAGPYAVGDAVALFDGVLDGSAEGLASTRVRFGITSAKRLRETTPRLFVAPPLCNHMPSPGSVMTWEGERFVLEGSDG